MFILSKTPRIKVSVDLVVSTENGKEDVSFKAVFKVPTDEYLESMEEKKVTLREAVTQHLVGLEDIMDDDNKPIPYSPALRDQLMVRPFMASALFGSLMEGLRIERAKN